jgi:broad specificity phosphatase PhoE
MESRGFDFSHAFELVVVRHGRTAWNATGRFQGQTDVPLDDTGREQARGVAALLRGEHFARAIASDLGRARETAEIALAGQPPALEFDERWREMRFGSWEGLVWDEIVARQPDLATKSSTTPRFYTPPGGESFDDLCERIADALADIDARANDGDRVLVATHAGPLHALLRVALGNSEADALGVRFSPASVTRLALAPGSARIVDLNLTAPVPGLP